MSTRARLQAFVLAAVLSSAANARAQFFAPVPATQCATPACGDPLSALLGGFGGIGLGLMPTNPGLAVHFGILHPHLISFEGSVIVPLSAQINDGGTNLLGSSSISVRLRLHHEELNTSGIGVLHVSFRAGLGVIIASQAAVGLIVGPNIEFIFGMFDVAIRPAIVVVSDPSDTRSLVPLGAVPLFDLSLGLAPRTNPFDAPF